MIEKYQLGYGSVTTELGWTSDLHSARNPTVSVHSLHLSKPHAHPTCRSSISAAGVSPQRTAVRCHSCNKWAKASNSFNVSWISTVFCYRSHQCVFTLNVMVICLTFTLWTLRYKTDKIEHFIHPPWTTNKVHTKQCNVHPTSANPSWHYKALITACNRRYPHNIHKDYDGSYKRL